MALGYYSRTRFIVNLLPLIRNATALRRVVSVFAGTYEGSIDLDDPQGFKNPDAISLRGHAASAVTLSLDRLARSAPEVTFIHQHPGIVKSGIGREANTFRMKLGMAVVGVIGRFFYIPNEESGARHLFSATSARYPPCASQHGALGIALADGMAVARGIDGKTSSGVYSIEWDGESGGDKVEQLLSNLKAEGIAEKFWAHTQEQFKRVTGVEAI